MNFYPHICSIKRENGKNVETGLPAYYNVYSGECYLQRGSVTLSGDVIANSQKLMIPSIDCSFEQGDVIELFFENGDRFDGKVKSSYPIDEDKIGGTEIELYHGE